MVSLKQLFEWFTTGKFPTEAQFAEQFKSFWHKSERIDQSSVLGLPDTLADKATKEDLANATTNFKGYHTSLAALLAIHPQNENIKDFFAWVGSPYPGTVYKVFANGGAWTDTGEVPTQQEIDLAEYLRIENLTKTLGDSEIKAPSEKAVKTETIALKDTLNLIVEETNSLDVSQNESNLEGGVSTGKYWNNQDTTAASTNWKCSTGGVKIPAGSQVRYEGGLYDDGAGIIVKNQDNSFIDFISAGAGVFKTVVEFTMPNNATHVKVSWLVVETYGKPLPFKLSWKDKGLEWHVATKTEFEPVEKVTYDSQDTIATKLVVKGANQEDIIYSNDDFTWVNNFYYTRDKEILASTRWKRASNPVSIIPNTKVTLNGEWYGQSAGCCVCDKDDNVVQFVCSPNPSTNIADAVQKIEFMSHADADRIYISYMKENGAVFDMNVSGKSPDKYFVTPIPYLDVLIGSILGNSDKGYNYISIVTPNMETPLNPNFMDAYYCVESGSFWGLNYVQKGYVVYWNGTEWNVSKFPVFSGGTDPGDGEIPENTDFDVVIVGGGAGGVSAAYALKDTGLKVALIEADDRLGGNHLNAWVNVHATTPPPPFLKSVIDPLITAGKAKYVDTDYQEFTTEQLASIEWKNSYLRKQYTGLTEACISLDVDATSQKYNDDLNAKINLILGATIINAGYDGKYARSVTYTKNNAETTITSKYFIDATGDNILLRLVGGTRLQGEESKTSFLEEYGFTENNAPASSSKVCNAPTLMYRVVPGTEDLSNVTASGTNDALGYFNPDKAKVYFNTVGYFGNTGQEVVENGAKATYEAMTPKALPHWKVIKTNNKSRFTVLDLPNKRFDIVAPKLAVRETYRAKCDRMLNENDLYIKISSENIKTGSNLDKKIACGNHLADIHGTNNVNVSAINTKRVPYGVSYGSIIPKGLNNLFVASRGAGLTHVGASSFRLNKDVMQLGWAAGHAAKICVLGKYTNTRDVDVEMLQNSDNTGFANTVAFLETIML